jgi:hypothetical protein
MMRVVATTLATAVVSAWAQFSPVTGAELAHRSQTSQPTADLLAQAAQLRKFTASQARAIQPTWTAVQVEQFSQAVRSEIVHGPPQPLSDEQITDVRDGLTYLLAHEPTSLEPPAFARACCSYATWLIQNMLSRGTANGDGAAVEHQIEEVAQLVQNAAVRLGVAKARAATAYDAPIDLPDSTAADAAQLFRQRARAARELAISPAFKTPLTADQIKQVRDYLDRSAWFLEWQTPQVYPSWMLIGNDPRDMVLADWRFDADRIVQAALAAVWACSIAIPVEQERALTRGFNARAQWLQSHQ